MEKHLASLHAANPRKHVIPDGLKGFPIKNTYSTPRGRAGPGGKSPQKSLSVAVEYIPDVRKDYKETLDEARARITGEFQGKPYHEWRRRALVFYILEAGGPEGRTVRQLCDGANALLEISPEAAAAHEREKDKENQNQNRTMNKENSNNKDDDGDGGDPTTTTTSTKDGPTPWIPRSVSTSLLMGEEAFCRVGKGLWALRAMPGVKAVKPLQTLGGAPVQSAKDKQQKEREEKDRAKQAKDKEREKVKEAERAAKREEKERKKREDQARREEERLQKMSAKERLKAEKEAERERNKAAALEAKRYPIDDLKLLSELMEKYEKHQSAPLGAEMATTRTTTTTSSPPGENHTTDKDGTKRVTPVTMTKPALDVELPIHGTRDTETNRLNARLPLSSLSGDKSSEEVPIIPTLMMVSAFTTHWKTDLGLKTPYFIDELRGLVSDDNAGTSAADKASRVQRLSQLYELLLENILEKPNRDDSATRC